MSPPSDPEDFAATLVHELFHSKLSALLDLVPLFTAQSGELLYSPWREDPRPLVGILHGAHSFLAVADFWRRQRTLVDDHHAQFAHFEFARCRDEVDRALQTLLESDGLTEHGVRFVHGMQARVASWKDLPIPTVPGMLARQAVTDHEVRWRLNNAQPDREQIRAAATAWLHGQRCPVDLGTVTVRVLPRDRKEFPGQRGRAQLTRLRLRDPNRFRRVAGDPAAMPVEATAADLAFVSGDYADAVQRYQTGIADHPDRTEQWAGLAMAYQQLTDDDAARILVSRPELVRAVHREIQTATGAGPEVRELARWLVARAPLPTGH
jgi:hypothetical protein